MADEPETKDGDVIIRCFSDKPTPHIVGFVAKNGDLVPYSPENVAGRLQALGRAEVMRSESGGRVYLHEDDHWIEIKAGTTRVDLVVEEVVRQTDQNLEEQWRKVSNTKH